MKGKVWVLLLGVLLVAALIAPTAFASWQSAQLNTLDYQDMMNNNNQDIMVRPVDVETNDAAEETNEQSGPVDGANGNNYSPAQTPTNDQFTQNQAQAWQDHYSYMNNMMGGMMGGYGSGNGSYGMMGGYGMNGSSY
ncbi:MAG: hypothetical protein FH756_00810 [Firmicutes bacterium]|nr:hypothetical protein [Bacillota bacterium]